MKPKLDSGEEDQKCLLTVLLENGKEITDFSFIGYAIDLNELKKSLEKSGDYFIFTCWCGEPQCTGIYEPVSVSISEQEFEWTIKEPFDRQIIIEREQLLSSWQQFQRDVSSRDFQKLSSGAEVTPYQNEIILTDMGWS